MGIKIATWNVERLKHYKDLSTIIQLLDEIDSDILVLTETDTRIKLRYPHIVSTMPAYIANSEQYQMTESRITIYSKFPCVEFYKTADPYTSVSPIIETNHGQLALYGTIIGIYGNRKPPFKEQLQSQTRDIVELSKLYENICVCGDYNLSFGDNYYFTSYGREIILNTFEECNIEILTRNVLECVDHIAISKSFTKNMKSVITEWNTDKALSDHKGISVALTT